MWLCSWCWPRLSWGDWWGCLVLPLSYCYFELLKPTVTNNIWNYIERQITHVRVTKYRVLSRQNYLDPTLIFKGECFRVNRTPQTKSVLCSCGQGHLRLSTMSVDLNMGSKLPLTTDVDEVCQELPGVNFLLRKLKVMVTTDCIYSLPISACFTVT